MENVSRFKKRNAAWLCGIFGGFGLHRVYTGRIWTGLGQFYIGLIVNFCIEDAEYPYDILLALGGLILFAWVVYDFVQILRKKFVDIDGNFLT
jgi:TM2 domain-containing membrane protein YozV